MAEHWQYTRDGVFLRDRAYPVLKGAAEFFLSFLVRHPDRGYLVTVPSCSPENVFRTVDGQVASICAGPTCDRAILYELFTFCIEASEHLGIDDDFRSQVEQAREGFPPYQVSGDGRLQEWLDDYEEPEPEHRHMSHLLGLYPFYQIRPDSTPKLAEAARKVLDYKLSQPGWEAAQWARAWCIGLFGRLYDGNAAYEHLLGLIREAGDNLMAYCSPVAGVDAPPFELDGNTGGSAGVVEMLVQCDGEVLHVLPALPKAWPGGYVCGLRTRGGYTVDIYWQAGALVKVVVYADHSGLCRIRYVDTVIERTIRAVVEQLLVADDFAKYCR